MVIGTPTVLNLIPGKVFPVVNVNQYDAGYQKTFLLYKGAEPFNIAANMAVTIRGTKGDRNGIADSAASTVGNNLVSVTLTEQMTAVAGPNIYELRIADMNGFLVGTVNFIMMVEPAALGDGTVISDSDLNYAADVLDKIQTEEATKNQVNTNTADISTLKTNVEDINDTLTEHTNELAQHSEDINELQVLQHNTALYTVPTAKGYFEIPDGYSCGGCCLDEDKQYLYVGVYKVSDDSGAYIAKFSYSTVLSATEGENITPVQTISFGSTKSHMNSLCYYDGKIYVGAYRNDLTGSYNDVNIIDLSNNSVTTASLPTPLGVAGIAILVIDDVVNVIAYHSSYTVYQVWHVINDTLMPVYSFEGIVNGFYIAQDMHVSAGAIYQLEAEAYKSGVRTGSNQIQVISMDGRLSFYIHLDGDFDELEGIVKEPSLDKFLLVSNAGHFYRVETVLPSKDRDVLDVYSYKRLLNKNHQFFPALADSISGACTFGTNTLGFKYLRSLTIPARTYMSNGFPINFLLSSFFAVSAIFGNSMFVDFNFIESGVKYELLMAYNCTNHNIGQHSGYTEYSIWEDGTRLKMRPIESSASESWYTGINAINRIPRNISIGPDTTKGYPATITYMAASDLLLS